MPKRSSVAGGAALSATKGSLPKTAAPVAERVPTEAMSPLDFMLSMLRDPEASIADRKWAAEKAAPYLHPRLQTVEHGGEVTLRHEDALKDLS